MGAGYIGSDRELQALAKKEGHPDPKSVKSFGELLNWIYKHKVQPKLAKQKKEKTSGARTHQESVELLAELDKFEAKLKVDERPLALKAIAGLQPLKQELTTEVFGGSNPMSASTTQTYIPGRGHCTDWAYNSHYGKATRFVDGVMEFDHSGEHGEAGDGSDG